jgi:hypothetical protein
MAAQNKYMIFIQCQAGVTLPGCGAIVCKAFCENGNATWHHDRSLAVEGERVDCLIVSFVEDMRQIPRFLELGT